MDWVSDENDIRDLRNFDDLVNTTPNNKEFSLRENDANSMMQSFLDRIEVQINIWDGGGNVVSNTCI